MSQALRHVIDSISPASAAHAEGARLRLASAGLPTLERLAAQLGGAQHASRVRSARRTIATVIGDHGAGDPGLSLGPDHPSVIAARAIADGTAALATIARTTHTPIVIVDAGARESAHLPAAAIRLGRAATRNLLREPAMTVVDATLGLDAGLALAISLSEPGLDLLAIGAIGLGSEVSTAALTAALTGDTSATEVEAAQHGLALRGSGALEILAAAGGAETAVLAGLILGAASINVPVILDGPATCAAALVATAFAPHVPGYLIAAHNGAPAIVHRLGLTPVFEVGLGHGEGTGAAMALSLVDQVAAVCLDQRG